MASQSIKVWDLPVRLVHWSLVIVLPLMWITAENSLWGWHIRLGHVLIALIVFRILWGFFGTRTARFRQFVRGPGRVIAYLRGDYDKHREVGHNPLGALAVLGLLLIPLAQLSMGLFAGDPYDGATGPLNPLVSVGTADTITDLHETFFYVVAAMVLLHVSAIAIYAVFLKQNLIRAMVTGTREAAPDAEAIQPAPWGRALGLFALSAGFAGWIYLGAPPLT